MTLKTPLQGRSYIERMLSTYFPCGTMVSGKEQTTDPSYRHVPRSKRRKNTQTCRVLVLIKNTMAWQGLLASFLPFSLDYLLTFNLLDCYRALVLWSRLPPLISLVIQIFYNVRVFLLIMNHYQLGLELPSHVNDVLCSIDSLCWHEILRIACSCTFPLVLSNAIVRWKIGSENTSKDT